MRMIDAAISKSDGHRALICAALSENPCKVIFETAPEDASRRRNGHSGLAEPFGSTVSGILPEDMAATKRCLKALKEGKREMRCGESGATFRFLLPVMGALGRGAEFYPEGRLAERPLSPLYEELAKHGCRLSPKGSAPFSIDGKLEHGIYALTGDVSSQFVSGLLFALPLLQGDSVIEIKGCLQSEPYVQMTLKTLKRFGIKVETRRNGYFVKGDQKYTAPESYRIEGDWSGAAFWLAAGAFLLEGIAVKGLDTASAQGDKGIMGILEAFGAKVKIGGTEIVVSKGSLSGVIADVSSIPDLAPVIAVLGAGAKGETRIVNAGRLRYKESDRLHSIAEALNSLGGSVKEEEDGLVIRGTGFLRGGEASSFGDHRIAMMIAIASLICREKILLKDGASVKKSYPAFFEDMCKLQLDHNIARA